MTATPIPFSHTDWKRLAADEAQLNLKNRYFETNPTNPTDQVALLSRPGLKKWMIVGDGPITAIYSQPGSFNDDLFVASGTDLWRIDSQTEAATKIGDGIFPHAGASAPEMAATSTLGETPAYLFCTDGEVLWVYVEDGYSRNVLNLTGSIANNDVVVIDTVYYKFTSGSVDAGTPAGSSGSPWLVNLGTTSADALQNLFNAINASGVAGTDYSTALTAHTTVIAYNSSSSDLAIRAVALGTAGDAIVTTETSAGLSWGHSGTLHLGGSPSMTQVPTPDDLGIVSLAYSSSYVICVVAQNQGTNGRFYWINPGDTTIDALNFATAERSPDPVFSVRAVGDQFWLLGKNTTEVWYPSGDGDAPFQRIQGKLFDRGIIAGTAIQIRDAVILVDQDGGVFSLGGSPQRISDNSIEERIRNAIRDFAILG